MKEAEKLFNQLQAIVTESLPSHVGDALQKRLRVADELEVTVKEHEKKIVEQTDTIQKKEKEISRLQDIINKHDTLTSREQAVTNRETEVWKKEVTQETEKLKYELENEKSKSQFCKEVSMGLVRNTVYRKHVMDHEDQVPYMHGNQMIYPTPINKSLNETQTEE